MLENVSWILDRYWLEPKTNNNISSEGHHAYTASTNGIIRPKFPFTCGLGASSINGCLISKHCSRCVQGI